MGEIQDSGLNRKIQDASAIAKDADALDAEIAELKNSYEQFFLGIERKPPTLEHQALKKKIFKLKGAFVRQTALKFRINALQQKFISYERLWARTLQEIEDGTYRRDLVKAKLHQKEKEQEKAKAKEKAKGEKAKPAADSLDAAFSEDVDFDADIELTSPPAPAKPAAVAARPTSPVPPAAAVAKPVTGSVRAARPATPGAAARPPSGSSPVALRPATASGDNLSDAKLRAVYDAYVTAKKRCQEDTSKLSFESVASNLRKQVPELMKQSGAQGVEFKIVIKDGKAVLRAIPK